jgi:predicted O-methyltransferase YrrM
LQLTPPPPEFHTSEPSKNEVLQRAVRPTRTVEVGMANGLSTQFIAQALRENGAGRHLAIDPFQFTDWSGIGMAMLQHAELKDLVELIEKPSHQALPELEQTGVRAQFVFIDGNHLFDYVIADFLAADRLLDVGGLMAFDDSDWPAITEAIRFIVLNRSYEVAYPNVIIEHAIYTPTRAARALRWLARRAPQFAAKFRHDFLKPSFELGLRGRCVVLRKMADDNRNGQTRFHKPF